MEVIVLNRSEKALIMKDINEITNSKQVFLPMAIVPIVLMGLLPLALVIGVNFIGEDSSILNDFRALMTNLPPEYTAFSSGQLVFVLALNYMFPSFFLLIPIMCSGVLGASSFVGEKEHKTMETLLYTPISMEHLLRAKILGVFIPSYLITVVSFVLFGIIVNIGGFLYFDGFIFPDYKWFIILLWLTPAISLLSLTLTVMISAKSKTFQEAQQVSGLLVIPIILILIGQMSGVLILNNWVLLAAGAILFVLDYILIKRISSRFNPENLI